MRIDILSALRRLPAALLLLSAAVLSLAPLAAQQPAAADEVSARLASLAEDLEEERVKHHVPGMAVAIVDDGELIYAAGFGVTDLDEKTPVTPETVFAIGSTTKAFTSVLAGVLVDEGQLSWDDPVTKHLPYFELDIQSDDADAQVTVRDLLAHRTGFTRMGILWAGNGTSREQILRTATKAEPWSEFRGPFFYNNVTYMAAGEVAGKVADTTWDELVRKRVFEPLGMSASTVSAKEAQKSPKLSRGYLWRIESEDHRALPMRPIDAIGPAGSINSSVLDMSRWIEMLLARGEFGGERLISERSLQETWTKQITIQDGIDYGMGWMLREIGGHRVVEHGGNIDGFSAQVTLVPDEGLGFVMLSNLSGAGVQGTVSPLVIDALLSEPEVAAADGAVAGGDDLGIFVGRYSANFGPFQDAWFTVSEQEGALYVDVPGQTNYELRPPNDEGRRLFALTDQIAVSFDRAADGSVTQLKMYQGGGTFELPREGVTLAAEIPLAELEPFVGRYHLEERKIDFEVKIQNQRLAVDIPGQMVFELHPPDEEGRRFFRVTDRVNVRFNSADDGTVLSMTITEPDDTRTMPRVREGADDPLPTVDEILALRKDTSDIETVRMVGKVKLVHSGVEGEIVLEAVARTDDQSYRLMSDFGPFGRNGLVVTETSGWTESTVSPSIDLEGRFLRQARMEHPLVWNRDFRLEMDEVRVLGRREVDGRDVFMLEAEIEDLPKRTLAIDAETGDVLRVVAGVVDPTLGVTIQTTTQFEDFREVDGLRLPFRTRSRNQWAGETVIELSQVETGVELPAATFERSGPASGDAD